MTSLPPLRLAGAQVLTGGVLADGAVTVAEGRIAEGPAPVLDLSGYLLLPGIVDLHGDGFERHLQPRPSAPFDKRRGLQAAAAELAAHGVTTAWFAQSWSWEGGFRSGDYARDLLGALSAVRGGLLPDVRVQIRLETHIPGEFPAVLAAAEAHGVDYVVFNDHLPEALEMAEARPDRFAQWAAQTGRSDAEMRALLAAAAACGPEVPAALAGIATALRTRGVRLGSHDDATPETRAFFRAIGAGVCEFPTTVAAAEAARAAGEPVLMGAPNVVRGGSQSGNIAAADLVAAGLCDGLVSDYYVPALAQAAFVLADRGILPLASAWGLISEGPARVAGLSDRGRIAPGLRADLVAVNAGTRAVELTLCAGRVAHLSGALAVRALSGGAAAAAAVRAAADAA